MTDDNPTEIDVSIGGRTIPMALVHQTDEAALATCACCDDGGGTAAILRADGTAEFSNDDADLHVEGRYHVEVVR